MEGQRTTVGNVDFTNALAVGCRGHLHLVRHIDNHPQPTAIDGNVVSYIAQFLDGIRVALRIDIPVIDRRRLREIQIIERTLVRTHVSFAKQIESQNVLSFHLGGIRQLFLLAVNHLIIGSTGAEQPHQRTNHKNTFLSHISKFYIKDSNLASLYHISTVSPTA